MVVRARIKSAAKLQKNGQNTKQKQYFSHYTAKNTTNLALNYSIDSKNNSKNICFNQIFRNFATKIILLKVKKTMKKLFFVISLMVAAVSANAQIEEGEWYITPKAGVGIADLTGKLFNPDKAEGSYDATLRPIASFVGGIEGEYGINDNLGFSIGLLFATQGAKTKDNMFKVTENYLNVPLMLEYYPFANIGLAFKAGAQVGFSFRRRVKVDGIEYSADYVWQRNQWGRPMYVESELSKQFNKVDLAIPLGVSYEYKHVILDVRYNLGLINVMKDDPENSKNRMWQFTLGYKFNVGD